MERKAGSGIVLTLFLAAMLSLTLPAPHVVAEPTTDTSTTIWCQEPVALAFDGSNMWVADLGDGQWSYLRKIRTHDGAYLRDIPLPEYSLPNDVIIDVETIAFGGTRPSSYSTVWVSYDAGVFQIQIPPNSTHCHRRPNYKGTCYVADPWWVPPDWLVPVVMAFDGTNLWVADAVNDVVIRMNARDEAYTEWVDTVYLPEGSCPSDLAFDGENIWVSNEGSNVVTKINALADDLTSEDSILDTIPVSEGPGKLACDGDNIWVTHSLNDILTKIRIADSSVSTIPLPEGSHPTAFAFDRVNMWVANLGQPDLAANVMKLSTDGTLLDTFTLDVGDNPTDLAFDGSYVWVACSQGSYLRKLPASTYPLTLEVSGQVGLSSGDPIRFAEVRLYTWWYEEWTVDGVQCESWGPRPEAVGQTDENGEFVIEVPWTDLNECIPPQHPDGATDAHGPAMFGVHFEVLARNEAADIRFWDGLDLQNYDAAHPPPTDPALTYFMRIPEDAHGTPCMNIETMVEEALASGQTRALVDLGYAEPEWSQEGAFHILNTISDAWNFLTSLETDLPYPVRPPPVVVAWSMLIGDFNKCVHHGGLPLMIQIGPGEARNPSTICHEYGHYIAYWYNFDNSPGGAYRYDDQLGWSEGWAFFFSDYSCHICYGEPFYYDWDTPPSQGSGDKSAVKQLLTVLCEEFGFERIWDVCYNHAWNACEFWSGPRTIHYFWFHWFERCSADQYVYELGRLTFLYERHGIEYIYTCRDRAVFTDIEFLDPGEMEPGDLGLPEDADLSNAIVISTDVSDSDADPTNEGYTDIKIYTGELAVETCWVYKQGVGPLPEVDLDDEWPLLPITKPPGVPVFARNVANNYVIVRLYVGDPLLGVIRDSFPPATQLTIGEPKFVDVTNTYVTSATPFTLTAEDNPSGAVASMAYRIHNIAYDSGWIGYTQAFKLIGLSDGTYHIDYNSTDNAGNVESTNTEIVILDNAPPTITISSPSHSQEYLHSETLVVDFDVTDEWSGVASVSAQLDGSPVNDGDLIDLLALTLNAHTLTITAVDNLGQIAVVSATFNVAADVDSLMALVDRFYDSGQIDDPEVRDGLLDKLYAAKALIEANKIGPARNILRAFIRQVEAQLGHQIAEEEANILLTDVEYTIEHL